MKKSFSSHSTKISLILRALRYKNDFHLQQSSLVCVTPQGVRDWVCLSLRKGHIWAGMVPVLHHPGLAREITTTLQTASSDSSISTAEMPRKPSLAQRQDKEYSYPAHGQHYLSAPDTAKWNASWNQKSILYTPGKRLRQSYVPFHLEKSSNFHLNP